MWLRVTEGGAPARASLPLRNCEPSAGRPLVVGELTGVPGLAGPPKGQIPSPHTGGHQPHGPRVSACWKLLPGRVLAQSPVDESFFSRAAELGGPVWLLR